MNCELGLLISEEINGIPIAFVDSTVRERERAMRLPDHGVIERFILPSGFGACSRTKCFFVSCSYFISHNASCMYARTPAFSHPSPSRRCIWRDTSLSKTPSPLAVFTFPGGKLPAQNFSSSSFPPFLVNLQYIILAVSRNLDLEGSETAQFRNHVRYLGLMQRQRFDECAKY